MACPFPSSSSATAGPAPGTSRRSAPGAPAPAAAWRAATSRRAPPVPAALPGGGGGDTNPLAGAVSSLFTRGRTGGLAAAPSQTLPPATPGEELGWLKNVSDRYHLGRTIGSGSYGVVYLGIDKATGGEVAVKAMLKQRPRSTRERTLKKLVREAALTARVQGCGGVVQLLGAYEDADRAYLVMERLRGGDLEAALERGGPLPERAAAAVARDVLRVIAACHAAGCMHGDVKPANFVLREPLATPAALRRRAGAGPEGAALSAATPQANPFAALALPGAPLPPPRWLVAIDFGCSQPVGRASLTRRTGTPVYMAPEVFRRDYGPEADLWSAGVMLYQLLSGRFPWWPRVADCRACTVDEVMRAVLSGEVPFDYGPWVGALPPASVAGGHAAPPPAPLSPECQALVRGLLTRDPSRRLDAAAALASPWFASMLGGEEGEEEMAEANNVVPIGSPDHVAAPPTPSPPAPPQHHHHAGAGGSTWFGATVGGVPGGAAAPSGTAMA